MNSHQLYLSIGIPTLAQLLFLITVILTWMSNRSNLKRLDTKLDQLVESFRSEMNEFAESFRAEMMAFRQELHANLIVLHKRVVKIETRLDR